jgi:hypothetical protein
MVGYGPKSSTRRKLIATGTASLSVIIIFYPQAELETVYRITAGDPNGHAQEAVTENEHDCNAVRHQTDTEKTAELTTERLSDRWQSWHAAQNAKREHIQTLTISFRDTVSVSL